jgi:hypothetical protein
VRCGQFARNRRLRPATIPVSRLSLSNNPIATDFFLPQFDNSPAQKRVGSCLLSLGRSPLLFRPPEHRRNRLWFLPLSSISCHTGRTLWVRKLFKDDGIIPPCFDKGERRVPFLFLLQLRHTAECDKKKGSINKAETADDQSLGLVAEPWQTSEIQQRKTTTNRR